MEQDEEEARVCARVCVCEASLSLERHALSTEYVNRECHRICHGTLHNPYINPPFVPQPTPS